MINRRTPRSDLGLSARSPKRSVPAAAAAAALALFAVPAIPADMDDFFTSAGAQYNITPAGVYQSSTLNVASGGSFVFRPPRKDFQPYYISPPSLKMGCGGIDFFLGSFGIPSKTEFVNFIRSIGTAMPGLAFQLALQSLSPDFEKQLTSFRNMMQKITQESLNACDSASWLLDKTGAANAIKAGGEAAAGGILQTLGVNSAAEARDSVRGDWSNIAGWFNSKSLDEKQGVAADGTRSGVDRIVPTYNLFWSAINSGKFATLTTQDKELLMSTVNNWIYKLNDPAAPDDPDNRTRSEPYAQIVDIAALLGNAQQTAGTTTNITVYQCDTTARCLYPTTTTRAIVPLAQKMYDAARVIQRGILTRSRTFNQTDLALVAGASSVPLLRLINATTYANYADFSGDMLKTWSELAAYELVAIYLEENYRTMQKLVRNAKNEQAFPTEADVEKMGDELIRQTEYIAGKKRELYDKVGQIKSLVDLMGAVDRAVSARLAGELRANMAFGATRSPLM